MFALSGCAGTEQASVVGTVTAVVAAKPVATVSAQGIDLPGRLVFARAGDLWIWHGATGSQLTQRGDLAQPAFSPDGSQIACVRRGPSFSDVVVLPASGGEPRAITDGDSTEPTNSFERARSTIWSFYPAFAPDGQNIYFASQAGPAVGDPAADYNLSLYRSDLAGGERTQVYASDEGQVGKMTVGPGGDPIFAFAPTTTAAPTILRYQDGGATTIGSVPSESYDPALSADGTWLTFTARTGDASDVYAVGLAGGEPHKLTTLGRARAGVISPDGTWLAFLALSAGGNGFDLWVAPVRASNDQIEADEARQITQGLTIDPDSGLAWAR